MMKWWRNDVKRCWNERMMPEWYGKGPSVYYSRPSVPCAMEWRQNDDRMIPEWCRNDFGTLGPRYITIDLVCQCQNDDGMMSNGVGTMPEWFWHTRPLIYYHRPSVSVSEWRWNDDRMMPEWCRNDLAHKVPRYITPDLVCHVPQRLWDDNIMKLEWCRSEDEMIFWKTAVH